MVGAVLIVLLVTACGALVQPSEDQTVSRDYEPPDSWRAGITFLFSDSTRDNTLPYGARIEFMDGKRRVRASGRDLFELENTGVRSPWYRIWVPEFSETATTLRVTIGDRTGLETVAEYPIFLRDSMFYYVRFGIGTLTPSLSPPPLVEVFDTRGYSVPAGARRAPTDSLWISYTKHTRDCFGCIY